MTASPATTAPVTGWRRAASDSLWVGGATLLGHALGAVTSLLLRWLLDPALIGLWQGLKLFLSYGNYANLGISKAAARELTLAQGSGAAAPARRAINLAFTVNTLSSAAYAIVLFALAAWLLPRSGNSLLSHAWAIGLAVIAAVTVLQRYVTFQVTILRSQQTFQVTSWLSVQEAVLTLAASAAAVWCWGIYGLFLATVLVLLGSLAYLRGRTQGLTWAWDTAEIRRLVAIGLPLLLAGMASSLFRSLDKIMILVYLDEGEFQLGCYSLALLLTVQLYGLANMLAGVMGPRYGELLGRTGDHREVARLAARATELQAVALALPAGLALAVAPTLLAWLLPKYQTGLAPLVWLIPGTLAAALALPASGYLVAVNRGRSVLAALLIAIGVAVIGNHVALSRGHGLIGVAVATMIADFVYLAILAVISIGPRLTTREQFRCLGMVALAMLPTLGVAAWFHHVQTDLARQPSAALAPAALVVGTWALTALAVWKLGGWQQLWRANLR